MTHGDTPVFKAGEADFSWTQKAKWYVCSLHDTIILRTAVTLNIIWDVGVLFRDRVLALPHPTPIKITNLTCSLLLYVFVYLTPALQRLRLENQEFELQETLSRNKVPTPWPPP